MGDAGKVRAANPVALPRVRRRWSWILASVAVVAIGWLVVETRRLAELIGLRDADLRAARRAADAATAKLAEESAARTVAANEVTRLGLELATANAQLQGLTEVLEKSRAGFEKARADSAAAERRAAEPMPEGVRACLAALHECLRAEGFGNHRFVRARSLDAEGLHDVEMYEIDADRLGITFLLAERMTADLDRGKQRLVLRFFAGHRLVGDRREELPADGLPVVFEPVDGRSFEHRLPYLIRAAGEYPVAAAKNASDVDPLTRRQWLERLDVLLEGAGTTPALRVSRFRGMADGAFLEAELIGTDDHHHVVSSAHCARLAVEVDRTANVVSLLLQSGVLRNGGRESTITADGYRMLLPNLDCKRATDVMLGMVVSR